MGHKFKTKKDVKDYINKHALDAKKDTYIFFKSEKTMIKAMYRGVAPYMSRGPWKRTRIGYKDKTVNFKQGECPCVVPTSRPKEIVD